MRNSIIINQLAVFCRMLRQIALGAGLLAVAGCSSIAWPWQADTTTQDQVQALSDNAPPEELENTLEMFVYPQSKDEEPYRVLVDL